MFGALFLGVSGGLLGALFIIINNSINIIRKKILKVKLLKIIESVILVIITVTAMYGCTAIKHNIFYDDSKGAEDNFEICVFKNDSNGNFTGLKFKEYLCIPNNKELVYGDRLATLFFDT